MRPISAALVFSLALAAGAPAQAQKQAGMLSEPKTWATPWDKTRPRDPFVDRTGHVWFVGQVGNYVANLDPKTGEFNPYTIHPRTHPPNPPVHPKRMCGF